MKKICQYLGLPLVYVGVACMCIEYVAQLNSNIFLFTGLTLIIGGIASYWMQKKKKERY